MILALKEHLHFKLYSPERHEQEFCIGEVVRHRMPNNVGGNFYHYLVVDINYKTNKNGLVYQTIHIKLENGTGYIFKYERSDGYERVK